MSGSPAPRGPFFVARLSGAERYNRGDGGVMRWSPLLLVGCGPMVEVPDVVQVHVSTPGTSCSPGDVVYGDDAGVAGYVVNLVDDFLWVDLEDEISLGAPVETSTTFVEGPSSTWTGTPTGGYTSAVLGPGVQAALAVSASVGCKTFGGWPDGVYTRKVSVTASEDDDPYEEKTYKFRVEVVVD